MTADGVIRKQYWSDQRYGPAVTAWAAQAGVEMSQDTVG
jgi:hypothetical protein